MQTPASVYEPSPREYPAKVPEPEYSDAMLVRSVKSPRSLPLEEAMMCSSVRCCGARGWACCRLTMRASRSILPHMPLARFDSRLLRVVTAAESCNRSQKHFIRRGHAPAG